MQEVLVSIEPIAQSPLFEVVPAQGPADPADVVAFDDVFNAPTDPLQGVEGVSEAAISDGSPTNLGEAILSGVEKMSRVHDSQANNLAEAISRATAGDEMTLQGLLEVQVELANISFHEQLTVKIADKSSEGIKTLFRNQ